MPFLDFGPMPLAGGFLPSDAPLPDKLFPLDIAVCEDCRLVFVPNVIAAEDLFQEYFYLSSVTSTLSRHFAALADEFASRLRHRPRHLVVEIGSNDGVFLLPLKERGVRAIGVDASVNVSRIAHERGAQVEIGFFGEGLAMALRARHGAADIITASNVFAHIDDVDDVVKGVEHLLAPHGTFVCEVHHLLDLVRQTQFDTMYHEHLCYYSLTTLARFFRSWGFEVVDVVRTTIHGGSIRIYVERAGSSQPSAAVAELLAIEAQSGLDETDTYLRFADRARASRDEIRDFCVRRRAKGERIVGYGAAGRGTTLLNYCGLDREMVDYVVDESPLRAGKLIPGVRVPVVPPEVFRGDDVRLALILAWNYEREIRAKETRFAAGGGKFITPLPRLRVDL